MPWPALSLVGFMDQDKAIRYLDKVCVPTDPARDALVAEWHQARAKLGLPRPNPGVSHVDDIQWAEHAAYLQAASVLPWIKPYLEAGFGFKQVDIDPLLAFQYHISRTRSENLCFGLPLKPTLADALRLCIPLTPSAPSFVIAGDPMQDLVIKSPSKDVRIQVRGQMPHAPNVFGIQIGWAPPFVQVLRFQGRCYLHNGFHRAFGLRRQGLLKLPCLFRDVNDFSEIGAIGADKTFERAELESDNPPTFGHFANDRAYHVRLRQTSRIIHVSWSEYDVPEE
jgi:hypothetical protein